MLFLDIARYRDKLHIKISRKKYGFSNEYRLFHIPIVLRNCHRFSHVKIFATKTRYERNSHLTGE